MNKDMKIAVTLAPFLLVGGYVLSDLYIESKPSDINKIFELTSTGECAMFSSECILESGDMKINITDVNGITKTNTSYPVDTVAISLVYNDGKEVIYGLETGNNPQYWEKESDIRNALTQSKTASKLRVVITSKESTYFSEFSPVITP